MEHSLFLGLNIVVPMTLLMLLGWYLRKTGLFTSEMLPRLNRIAFSWCVAPMMFLNIYHLKSIRDVPVRLILLTLFSFLLFTLVGILVAKVCTSDLRQQGVVVQMSFRSNYAVIGMIVASSLGGQEGAEICSTLQAPSILYFNIMAVICLTVFLDNDGERKQFQFYPVLKSIMTNPLVVCQFLGLVCLFLRDIMPFNENGLPIFLFSRDLPWLYNALRMLSAMATPLTLLVLGAQIRLSSVSRLKGVLAAGLFLRLVAAPFLGMVILFVAGHFQLVDISLPVIATLLALYATPAPVAGAVMAEVMGSDGELARHYVVWSTVLSMLTLLVWIFLLSNMHLL